MDDIFQYVREGNPFHVRVWLDDTEHDMNEGDDHGFSPLHWAAKYGHVGIVEMLIQRGARIGATNMGDDTPLHLAAAHGHRPVVQLLLRSKADVNLTNEHGNTPLHYACFWSYQGIADDLIQAGALVTIANRFGKMPLDCCKGSMATRLHELAVQTGQELRRIEYKDQSWLGMKTRSRDATLSRHKGIAINDLNLHVKIATSPTGETWRGKWQGNEICAKILALRECTARISRDFNDEFPRLRIFSHPNIQPVLGCSNSPPSLVVVNQLMPHGSLYDVLHRRTNIVVDTAQALRFALDVARGMCFLHSLERNVPNFHLSSRHVMIDEDMTALLNMADAEFSFQNKGKVYYPQWYAPEALLKSPSQINRHAADMWSFAVLLWEMATRDVPFAEYSAMEIGMKVATEGLRLVTPPGISAHIARLITICMNEDPKKRPNFDQIVPILEKMVDK
ncbi:integrin-linked protein kinase homolog pat-4-like [Pollicipes pollicipes]|uniref:integrin-linked protein kinase homolog pat-4-like n=1 Tax=Pollicipes pollicipes TaxID=41117 RepID=UPI0018855C44|nr:integrin-linked protein kinase homolog pat-4-like [Pollicipes pollicipes]XP_037070458.1 integrin-linked protein kinase homolog pat-4-like [Pollicipes pollicipes]